MRSFTFLTLISLVAGTALATDLLPGVVDTIGGTTYDNQNSGPSLRMLVRDPQYGIHMTWTYSAQPSTWPDRTMRYNFFDYATETWNWIETDFMSSGMNSQTRRTGYGTLDIDPSDGSALVGCHYNAGGMPPHFTPTVQRDLAPGAGLFDECVGAPTLTDYFLPVLGVTSDRTLHFLLIKFQTSDNLYYTRSSFWCTWDTPVWWNETGAFGHNLTADHNSLRVLATWMTGSNESLVLGYRLSTDAGETWDPVQYLPAPTAWLGDTISVCARGASVIFDGDGNWLLATTVLPAIGDSAYSNPAQLWLYNSTLAEWHRIHRAEAQALAGGFGSFAAICDRPSLGLNHETGRLYAAWEQFDSSNVEASTNLLRADIMLAWSDDGGTTWEEPALLTEPDESSKRLPHLAYDCSGDSVTVGFVQDVIAGFNVDEVGAISNNPVCVWHGQVTGIAESPSSNPGTLEPLNPTLGSRFVLALGTTPGSKTLVTITDVSGRTVRSVESNGSTCAWDGRDDNGRLVTPGCYLARWTADQVPRREKLVLTR